MKEKKVKFINYKDLRLIKFTNFFIINESEIHVSSIGSWHCNLEEKKKMSNNQKKKKKMEFYSFVEGSIIVEKADSISKYKGAKQRGRKNVICNSVSFF